MEDVERFGSWLGHALYDPTPLGRWVDDVGVNGWTEGGCVVLAVALKKVLGGGKVIALATRRKSGAVHFQHAGLVVRGWVLDGDGVTRLGLWERNWVASLFHVDGESRVVDWDMVRHRLGLDYGLENLKSEIDGVARMIVESARRDGVDVPSARPRLPSSRRS